MDKVVPWAALVALIAPFAPGSHQALGGRPSFPIEIMLRIHCLQLWWNLSDPAMEEELHERPLYRRFAGLDGAARMPDETTILRFRDFFLKGWPLLDVLEMNFEGDLDGSLEFFTCTSDFYPEFDRACRDFVIENFPVADEDEEEPGDTCPICEKFNATPSGDTCEHLCAWQWDGQLEIVNGASSQESHWTDLVDLVSSREDDSPEDVILKAQEKKSPTRAKLINAASRGCSLIEVLTDILGVQSGKGWSTSGMLGGAG